MNQQPITDSIYMGPWLADTIRQCDGLVDMMSYWTFSDVFEEQGVVKTPFYGGYGIVAEGGIPKPAYQRLRAAARARRGASSPLRRTRLWSPAATTERSSLPHGTSSSPAPPRPDKTFTLDLKSAPGRQSPFIASMPRTATRSLRGRTWRARVSHPRSDRSSEESLRDRPLPKLSRSTATNSPSPCLPRAWRWSRFTSTVSHVTAPGRLAL